MNTDLVSSQRRVFMDAESSSAWRGGPRRRSLSRSWRFTPWPAAAH